MNLASDPAYLAMRADLDAMTSALALSGARLDAREAASAKATAAAAEQATAAEGAELSKAPEVKATLDETIAAMLASNRSTGIERGRILHDDLVRAGDHAAAERLVTAMREGLHADDRRRAEPMNAIVAVPYGPGGLDFHASVHAAFLSSFTEPKGS
jgi:hypothetical protein